MSQHIWLFLLCVHTAEYVVGKVCFIRMLFHIVYASESIEHAAHTAEFDAIGISIMFCCVCCVTQGKMVQKTKKRWNRNTNSLSESRSMAFSEFRQRTKYGMKVVTLGTLCSRDRKAFFFLGALRVTTCATIPQHIRIYNNIQQYDICHKFGFDLVLKMDKFMKIVAW